MLRRLLTLLLLFNVTVAMASPKESGWYLGFQFGESDSHYNNSDINSIINTSGISLPATTTTQSVDTDGWAWRPYFGYQFNPFFGVELGFAQFADVEFDNIFGIPGYNINLEPRATDFVAKVMFPIADFTVYAKLGVAYLEQSLNFDSQSLNPSLITDIAIVRALAAGATADIGSNNKFVGVFGLGASYFFYKNISAELSWTRYQGGGSTKDVDFAAIGINYYLC